MLWSHYEIIPLGVVPEVRVFNPEHLKLPSCKMLESRLLGAR